MLSQVWLQLTEGRRWQFECWCSTVSIPKFPVWGGGIVDVGTTGTELHSPRQPNLVPHLGLGRGAAPRPPGVPEVRTMNRPPWTPTEDRSCRSTLLAQYRQTGMLVALPHLCVSTKESSSERPHSEAVQNSEVSSLLIEHPGQATQSLPESSSCLMLGHRQPQCFSAGAE